MRNALVIAGGMWQRPLVKYLQEGGYSVTVVDPYTTSASVSIAERHIALDVREKEAILEAIQESGIRYHLVCTDQSDISVDTVAYLAEKLDLPGNSMEAVERFANKFKCLQYAEKVNMPVPEYCQVSTLAEVKAFLEKQGAPLIIKPCDSQSSKGIHVIDECTTDEEIKQYLADALQYSFIHRCILERFVFGYEITVEGFCADGKHHVTAVSKKRHFKTGIASTLTYPGEVPDALLQRIIEADDRFVENSGLRFGPTHAEYIVNEDQDCFWLVEIACRGGGTLISSDIVKWVSGFDVYDAYLRCLEGNESSIDMHQLQPLHRSAELHFFDFGTGDILHVEGVETVRNMDGVIYADLDCLKVGTHITSCQDDRSRQGFVIVFAKDKEQLATRISAINHTLVVQLKK